MIGGKKPQMAQVVAPVADILDRPSGLRQRQLLFGDVVEVVARDASFASVRALKDGYTGQLRRDHLGPLVEATHKVVNLATHLYEEPDFKSRDMASLSFGSRLTVIETEGRFSRIREGAWVPTAHLAKVGARFGDPAAVAELFLGTPYLWGGNSRLGLDCSGLVQTACLACGFDCPGDTGDQQGSVGAPVGEDEPLQRGDILFWKGHVAMAVSDDMLIHANAYHMATVFEPAGDAARRIQRQGDGPVTARRRLPI